MELENQPLEKEIPFEKQHFSGSMLNFRGVLPSAPGCTPVIPCEVLRCCSVPV